MHGETCQCDHQAHFNSGKAHRYEEAPATHQVQTEETLFNICYPCSTKHYHEWPSQEIKNFFTGDVEL